MVEPKRHPDPSVGETPIRVVLVEDHAFTRAGLRTALEADGVRVVAEVGDGISAQDVIVREQPTIAIIDIGLPGRDGIALTRSVRHLVPATRIVIVTMHEVESDVLDAFAAGADAYCLKSSESATVIDAVRTVAAGGAYFDPRIAHVILKALRAQRRTPQDCPLTPRELDVLHLIVDGVGNAEIAKRLDMGLGTVKSHVREILEKLSAVDRTQAAVNAMRRGYL